jgi:hypothetical protein
MKDPAREIKDYKSDDRRETKHVVLVRGIIEVVF